MGFTRRVFLGGAAGLAGVAGARASTGSRWAGAQAGAWDVVDLITLTDAISFNEREHRGFFFDMNTAGEISGAFAVSDVKFSPTIWSPAGKAKRLKSGKYGGEVNAINNNGVAVGSGYLDILGFPSEPPIFLPDNTAPRAWLDGTPVELEMPGDSAKGTIYDVNDDGVMVGYVLDPALNQQVPVMWRDGAATGVAGGSLGGGYAIRVNNAGDIGGYASVEGSYAAVLWRGDEMEALAFPPALDLPADSTASLSIIELGDNERILASVTVPNTVDASTVTYSDVSFVQEKGEWTMLASPDESRPSVTGVSINANGAVVGSIQGEEDVAFALWEDGVGRILNDEFELPGGLTLTRLIRINDEGQILARATGDDSSLHAIVLSPTA